MNKIDTIKQIKESLKKLLSFTEEKFGTLVLSDGTKVNISTSDIEIGAEVYALDDLGNQTPCENGDYVLQDGRTFTVTDNKISDIKATEAEPEKPVDGDTTTVIPEDLATDGAPVEEVVEDATVEVDLGKRVDELEKKVEELLNIISKSGVAQNDLNEQMMNKINKFSVEAGGEPIKGTKKGFEEYSSKQINAKKQKSEEVFAELRDIMKAKRKIQN